MRQLQPIEQNGKRVLTTSQLAESFGTDEKRISENFSRNKDRYTEGKHYFLLQGDLLREFKETYPQIAEQSRRAPQLYLWTEKGAWLHAKSLNTDRAWDAYEKLVDEYYEIKDEQQKIVPLSKDQALVTVLRTTADLVEAQQEIRQQIQEHAQKIEAVERKVDEQITIDSGEQKVLQKAIAKRVYELESDPKKRRDLFRQLHREIRDRWAVPSYCDVRRTELEQVLKYIDAWWPRVA